MIPSLFALAIGSAVQPTAAPTIDNSVTAIRTEYGDVLAAADPGLTPATQFQAGSISKWACSVAILRMVDSDRFTLDSTIGDVLPGYEGKGAATIRVRDLLANRSGLADGLMPALREQGPEALLMMDIGALEAANMFAAGDPAAPRDSDYSYDLVNWIMVQAILEHQSSQPIADYLADDLFGQQAANLADTFIASGIPDLNDAPAVEGDVMPVPGWLQCAGGMVTTPVDLIGFMYWVEQDALSVDGVEALMEPTTWNEDGTAYTLGGSILIDAETDQRVFWLSGSNGAFKSRAAYNLWTGEAFAAMNAVDDAGALSRAVETWYWGEQLAEPIMPPPAPPGD
ncbi:serine hydrolase domain-containing protein [Sphingomicrobium sediminis]|uniref:Beta-lactamase family protein n=1 Tax=Sphingomicrobium sediminis TaxID=2950949 RepID=A0A9X2EHI1_9SPHN|nr:serine hydrolase domain-containing protein [Sphingomicrobium sediminis]MCM8557601.1 beta-lactamase family protein [Sphingomicrobium sediminis]